MSVAMYYKTDEGNYILADDTFGYYCSPKSYSFIRVMESGLHRVGWGVEAVSKELVGAKPLMRLTLMKWE